MPSNIIITFNLPRNCFTSLLPQTEGSVTLKGFGVGVEVRREREFD